MSKEVGGRPKLNLPKRLVGRLDDAKMISQILDKIAASSRPSCGVKTFKVMFGPPFTSGTPHLGTIYSELVKDVMANLHANLGKSVELIPGFDCHGLPTEKLVAERWGHGLSHLERFKKCMLTSRVNGLMQISYFKRFGILADWSRTYWTAEEQYECLATKNFYSLVESGMVRRRLAMVKWCTMLSSVAPMSEISTRKISVSKGYFLMPILDEKNVSSFLCVYTETPWSLPANDAVGFDDAINYWSFRWSVNGMPCHVVMRRECELARKLKLNPIDKFILVENMPYFNPINRTVCRTCRANFVKNKNTGLVHIAPLYSRDDFLLKKNKRNHAISRINLHDGVGYRLRRWNFETRNITKASLFVTFMMGDMCIHHSFDRQEVEIYNRSNMPVVDYYTDQVFALTGMPKVQARMHRIINSVDWVRQSSKDYMLGLCGHERNWCLSRNRIFNTPMIRSANLGSRIKHYLDGVPGLDVWFDSANSFEFCYPKGQVDLVIEGVDQYRGYFLQSIRLAAMLNRPAPFRKVLVTGFVVDMGGNKLSKSKGNFIDPLTTLVSFHPDTIRLWACRSRFFNNISVDQNVIKQCHDIYFKIRNTTAFLNYYALQGNTRWMLPKHFAQIDKWMLHSMLICWLDFLRSSIRNNMAQCMRLVELLVDRISSWHLNYAKPYIYTREYSWRGRSAVACVKMCYDMLKLMLRPMLTILSYELAHTEGLNSSWEWENIDGKSYLFQEDFETVEVALREAKYLRCRYEVEYTGKRAWDISATIPSNSRADCTIVRDLTMFKSIERDGSEYRLFESDLAICQICHMYVPDIRADKCKYCLKLIV